MERGVHDLGRAEAQHQVDAVRIGAGLARHERRVAVERDAGARDRCLVLRRRHHRIGLAGERRLDRRAREGQRRDARRRGGAAEVEGRGFGLRTVEHIHRIAGPVRLADARNDAQLGRDSARCSMPCKKPRIADDHRMAGGAHRRIERSLQADLRPDAGRIAGRDRDDGFVRHGTSRIVICGRAAASPLPLAGEGQGGGIARRLVRARPLSTSPPQAGERAERSMRRSPVCDHKHARTISSPIVSATPTAAARRGSRRARPCRRPSGWRGRHP